MPIKKQTITREPSKKVSSSGSDQKSKRIVQKKMTQVMDEFKHKQLNSGSGERVSNPKQAVAIGLSEARKAGAKIPPAPAKKSTTAKKSGRVSK